MNAKPVFEYLTNSLVSDTGLEYFSSSNKAVSIARLHNQLIREVKNYAFLFNEVRSIAQKIKNEERAKDLGCPLGMLHFLYVEEIDSDYNRYIIHSDFNFIIIEAKKVELIEGVKFL